MLTTSFETVLRSEYQLDQTATDLILENLTEVVTTDEKMTQIFFERTKSIAPLEEKSWDPNKDATCAAPESHRVLADNPLVRVLLVTVPPGKRELFHTHKWSSIMVVVQTSPLTYYTENNSRESNPPRGVYQLPPEGLHSVENRGEKPFLAVRFEVKKSLN